MHNVPHKFEIKPRCFPFNKNGQKIRTENCTAFSSAGWYLPCCWIDTNHNHLKENYMNLWDAELHISTGISPREVLNSNQWKNFFKKIFQSPKNASETCKYYCGSIIYKSCIQKNISSLTSEEKDSIKKTNFYKEQIKE